MKSITLAEMHKILMDHKPHDFGIVLTGGIVSRKTVTLLRSGAYKIRNHIDETTQTLDSMEIQDEDVTNIPKAARKGALIELN